MSADNIASKEKFPWGHLRMALCCPRCLTFSAGWTSGEQLPGPRTGVRTSSADWLKLAMRGSVLVPPR